MQNNTIQIGALNIPVYQFDTVIIGSGASGYAAADRLSSFCQKSIAVVTEHVLAGTSRNTGSDKQTYYKLTLAGDEPDSVTAMARTLMEGGCVDGDLALCEAALSSRCFFHLTELGVPFPSSRYGEFIGYKTDHDPKRRATSAGPYTSKMMTEALEKSVQAKQVPVFNHLQVIRILTRQNKAVGLLCLNHRPASHDSRSRFAVFQCHHVICATGGPAGIYYDSVYPHGHFGASGLIFEAGAAGKNLTEWQYGLASVKPRWNVSGTYMQALPRFISTNPDGSDEQEFLTDYFMDKNDLLLKIFLKGYQWPFDVRKLKNGSSIIDVLVYLETQKGRRVFLDYRRNPAGGINFDTLPQEAAVYLRQAGACFGTPFERLLHMNEPAVSFYRDKGVDLETAPLEIALCAQHNNGGVSVDKWWQTCVDGLFCIGEAAGTHGIYRPGGTALNAGQVGALRAAQYIASRPVQDFAAPKAFEQSVYEQVSEMLRLSLLISGSEKENVSAKITAAQKRMSRFAAAFRTPNGMSFALAEARKELRLLPACCHVERPEQLKLLYRLRDILICQCMYLTAMLDFARCSGCSRGSALYENSKGNQLSLPFPEAFAYLIESGQESSPFAGQIQELTYSPEKITVSWRSPRPLPDYDDFFENVWKQYRENKNVF